MNIRNIALCHIEHNGRILVFKGHDSVKDITFHRLLGGGIEFGETAKDTAIRELKEEINVDVDILSQATVFENVFSLNGEPRHEVAFLFAGQFKNKNLYTQEEFIGDENGEPFRAFWVSIDDFLTGQKTLYPEAYLNFLNRLKS